MASIHATYEPRQRTAGVRKPKRKAGETVQNPAENEMRRSHGSLEGKTKEVVEIVGLKPLRPKGTDRVEKNWQPHLLNTLKQRKEFRIRQIPSVDVGSHVDTLDTWKP